MDFMFQEHCESYSPSTSVNQRVAAASDVILPFSITISGSPPNTRG
ncbi:hypothetical protein L195_g049591 [Trifolium pratense]|uniref:Uncharacterized protein n=1 Tax=Trifolium pratense TaxID=57577 RepID=A0A2K3JPK0_TRIPR|nr:hypothetical protein L195_g049591 [Trifolium pratense]